MLLATFILLLFFWFCYWAEGDDAGFAAGGGDFEVDDAKAAAFLATVGAAIAGADHNGVLVTGFATEKHVDVGGFGRGAGIGEIGGPEDEVAGLEFLVDGVIGVASIGGNDGEVFLFAEPIVYGAGAARRGDLALGEEENNGTGAVHALGEGGGAGFVGDLGVSGEGLESELEHGLGGGREGGGPVEGNGWCWLGKERGEGEKGDAGEGGSFHGEHCGGCMFFRNNET